jgi:hypothetical protein
MAESFDVPDETERLQVNLEDDVRAFLLSRRSGNQMEPEKRAELLELGVDVKRLSRPSYIAVNSGCDKLGEDTDPTARGCHVGAEGVMVHEDEAVVHLAFKCGDEDHEMHYTGFMPASIIEMAKAMEAVWPGSIMGPLLEQAVKLGRAETDEGAPSPYFMANSLDDDDDDELEEIDLDEEEEEDDFFF